MTLKPPGLYVTPDVRGWMICREPNKEQLGAYDMRLLTILEYAFRELKVGEKLFVFHPAIGEYRHVTSLKDAPEWCRKFF